MIASHRLLPHKGGTAVELPFSSEGLFAHIVSMALSRLIREYVATEAGCLKRRCELM